MTRCFSRLKGLLVLTSTLRKRNLVGNESNLISRGKLVYVNMVPAGINP